MRFDYRSSENTQAFVCEDNADNHCYENDENNDASGHQHSALWVNNRLFG